MKTRFSDCVLQVVMLSVSLAALNVNKPGGVLPLDFIVFDDELLFQHLDGIK